MNDQIDHPPIPVICDRCRATGFAGSEAFSAIPDILAFDPVPRRARADGWKEEHQRAFIAALAITGSPRQAARAIGRHLFGAEQLRKARGGRSFADAWEAALELARERESHRIHENLAELVKERDGQNSLSPPSGGESRREGAIHPDCDYDPDIHTDDYPEYWEGQKRIRERMHNARRMFLFILSDDEDKRQAWETLCGPVDWAKAIELQPQPDEPFTPNMLRPDMVVTAGAGMLPELTGEEDALAETREALAAARESHPEDFD